MATKKKFLGNNGLDANNLTISNVATPSASSDASTKGYADTLVPSQAGNSGKYLTTNGSATSWATVTASASAETLTGTTIASNVTGSSLTSVGTLGSLTVSGNATFDTNTLFVSSANDRVGIGTVSPSSKLHIDGNFLRIDQGGANIGYFGNAGDLITGAPSGVAIRFNDNALRFACSSTQIAMFDTAGNFGIGVTPSAWGGSFATTQYKGGFIGSQASGYLYTGQNTYYNGTDWKYINTAAVTMMEQSAGVFIFYRAASGTAGNNVSFSESMRITSGGNVGIGTSNPLARLDIVGDATPNGNGLAFGHANTAGYKWIQSFAGQALYINPLGNNVIFNRDGGSVGIGTVSPAYKLDVNGTLNASGAITQNGSQVLHAGNYSSYALPLSGGVVTGSTYYRKNQTDGSYGTASLWTESYGNTTTGIAFHISGVVGKFLEMRTNGTLYFDNNTMIHSGNYSSYAIPNSGSWLGDLGSYGFTRYAGMSMSGGAEVSFLYKGGQGYTLVDGSYYAFEGGGFYSSSNSSGGTLIGMKAIATNTLELNARTSIRRSAYTVGASDFFMELTAPDDGSGNGEIGLRFHLESRYWRQIRANSGGFKFTQGSTNDTVNITAYDVIAQNDVSASRYVNSVYFNQSSGNSENPTIGQIWTQNTTDNYCRKSTPAHFKNQMGMYVNGGSSTSNNITISSSSATGGSNGDIWLKY